MPSYTIAFTDPAVPDQGEQSLERDGETYLLVAAEQSGLDWPYSTRAGTSSTSAAKLISGKVDQSDQSFFK
ncbi:ferredoxin-1 [Penicillium lividum]|nr:ferredoxin-1 [Penicillium lividum]